MKLLDTLLTEASKECCCDEKGLRDVLKKAKAKVTQFSEVGTHFVVNVEYKGSIPKLEKAVKDKYPAHLQTVGTLQDGAFVIVWKN